MVVHWNLKRRKDEKSYQEWPIFSNRDPLLYNIGSMPGNRYQLYINSEVLDAP